MEADIFLPLPQKKSVPLAIEYNPFYKDVSLDFLNLYLGYPNCPLIGRYNKGEYKISDTLAHLQFECVYNPQTKTYKCGQHNINIPKHMLHNLRNIPQVIKHNKPQNMQKNSQVQDTHPLKFPVLDSMKFIFMITFGQLGNDFLNYLNHMYTLGMELFVDQKLKRTVYHLPIYAYLPQKSGLMTEQVQRGLNLQNYRSQYMSLHLKFGAPAFSPNNMRLGVEGMKKIVSNPHPKKNKEGKKEGKKKFIGKQQFQNLKNKQEQKLAQKQQQNYVLDWDEIQNQIKKQKQEMNLKQQQLNSKQNQKNKQTKQDKKQKNQNHKGFVHFYTSVLLQNDYRVYYHWHIENQFRKQMVSQAFTSALSVQSFVTSICSIFGQQDQFSRQISKIFQ